MLFWLIILLSPIANAQAQFVVVEELSPVYSSPQAAEDPVYFLEEGDRVQRLGPEAGEYILVRIQSGKEPIDGYVHKDDIRQNPKAIDGKAPSGDPKAINNGANNLKAKGPDKPRYSVGLRVGSGAFFQNQRSQRLNTGEVYDILSFSGITYGAGLEFRAQISAMRQMEFFIGSSTARFTGKAQHQDMSATDNLAIDETWIVYGLGIRNALGSKGEWHWGLHGQLAQIKNAQVRVNDELVTVDESAKPSFVILHGSLGHTFSSLRNNLFISPEIRLGAAVNTVPPMIAAEVGVSASYGL